MGGSPSKNSARLATSPGATGSPLTGRVSCTEIGPESHAVQVFGKSTAATHPAGSLGSLMVPTSRARAVPHTPSVLAGCVEVTTARNTCCHGAGWVTRHAKRLPGSGCGGFGMSAGWMFIGTRAPAASDGTLKLPMTVCEMPRSSTTSPVTLVAAPAPMAFETNTCTSSRSLTCAPLTAPGTPFSATKLTASTQTAGAGISNGRARLFASEHSATSPNGSTTRVAPCSPTVPAGHTRLSGTVAPMANGPGTVVEATRPPSISRCTNTAPPAASPTFPSVASTVTGSPGSPWLTVIALSTKSGRGTCTLMVSVRRLLSSSRSGTRFSRAASPASSSMRTSMSYAPASWNTCPARTVLVPGVANGPAVATCAPSTYTEMWYGLSSISGVPGQSSARGFATRTVKSTASPSAGLPVPRHTFGAHPMSTGTRSTSTRRVWLLSSRDSNRSSGRSTSTNTP